MATPTRRRWFQFSIRTMLALIVVIGLWLAWGLHWVKSRNEVLQYLKANPWSGYTDPSTPIRSWREFPLTLRLLRAEPMAAIHLQSQLSEDDRDRIQSLFPEASVTLAK